MVIKIIIIKKLKIMLQLHKTHLNSGSSLNTIDNRYSKDEEEKPPNSLVHLRKQTSILSHERRISQYIIMSPREILKERIIPLEKELFSLMNLEYGIDVITEDILLVNDVDTDNNKYYVHVVRNGILDPNKENFLLLHGFLSSWVHFLVLLPYLLKKYNVFIPDNIGMGLSSRPKINFISGEQCENYFIEVLYIMVKKIFFSEKYNIKNNFFIAGHSLGGFIVSRYILKYPKGIKKVLLLSPAGITDYRIPGTNILETFGCCLGCIVSFISSCLWPCKLRLQNFYRCSCLRNKILQYASSYTFKFNHENIKKNPDGSEFIIDYDKIFHLLKELVHIGLDYPDDIYQCIYYIFTLPPPSVIFPLEGKLYEQCKFDCVILFGKNDWMDRIGSYRLSQADNNRFKVFTINDSGHSFCMENPKEVEKILDEFFHV